jgi:ribosomal protein S18 acetylase RimI-like enzyme
MIRIRPMTTADVSLGMRLVAQARWNQLPSDWDRFLAMQPDGCFVAEIAGNAVGTAVACVFGDLAWIAMVLVDEPLRGQGIGAALVQHALKLIDAQGVRTVRLDATPLGQPIYEKLGFRPQYSLTRFVGQLPNAQSRRPSSASLAQPADYPRLLAFDEQVTHVQRGKFLTRLFAENQSSVRWVAQDKNVLGWMTVRPGRQAWQLGPCLAEPPFGEELLDDAARQLTGEQVLLDVPVANAPAIRWAESTGLGTQRHFVRMYRGQPVGDDVSRLWASSGPELG